MFEAINRMKTVKFLNRFGSKYADLGHSEHIVIMGTVSCQGKFVHHQTTSFDMFSNNCCGAYCKDLFFVNSLTV